VARAWVVLGRHLEVGEGVRTDRVSAREAYKEALKGEPGVAAVAAFQLAVLLEAYPELVEEYGDGRRSFGTSPEHYYRKGAELALEAAETRFKFWAPNQRGPELAAALKPVIVRRRQEATFGDPEAMYEVSRLLEDGFGVPRHRADAAMWLHRAAKAGHLAAACRLRGEGWHDVIRLAVAPAGPPDHSPALAEMAGPGNAPALGGVPASPFQAMRAGLPRTLPVRWAGAVAEPQEGDPDRAEAGDLEAQLRLGAAQDDLFWLTLAAASGHPSAFPLRDALPASAEAEDRAAAWWERH
jgi:TPR repeat protein